ncbi:hypothetical protein A1F94_004921 [Pyrenophora tritici-repentis]|nr:hypothetical protein A1F94_004921 [Pyrenophora tritici-repentis]
MPHSHHLHHMRHQLRHDNQLGSPITGSKTMHVFERATRVLVARAESSCTNDSDPGCTKPTQVPTMAIALAVIVPIVGVSIVLCFLHRRNKRKLAEEDSKDQYKSNDWGMEGVAKTNKKKRPEMSLSEKDAGGGHDRGLSIEAGSPYILPVGLHGSRESFHSLSRSQHDPHDPYGPVAFLKDDQSTRGSSVRGGPYRNETGSVYTTSSSGTRKEGLQAGLLQNAQRMSTSNPVRGDSLSPVSTSSPDTKFPDPGIPLSPLNPRFENQSPISPPAASPSPSIKPNSVPTISIPEPGVTEKQVSKSPVQTSNEIPSLPRIKSQAVVLENTNTHSIISTSSYGEGFQITPPSPTRDQPKIVAPKPRYSTGPQNVGLGVDDFGHNTNRLSMSLRPMPPSDDPQENPEERANRIRSFYKEYFDDSKPEPAGGHIYNDYVEDYGSEYQDGTVFDPRTGNFVVAQPNAPFAEPITRRAMTPPPRAPPRFRSNTATGRGAHMSNSSVASSQYPPPRGMSSMSGRLPPPP